MLPAKSWDAPIFGVIARVAAAALVVGKTDDRPHICGDGLVIAPRHAFKHGQGVDFVTVPDAAARSAT